MVLTEILAQAKLGRAPSSVEEQSVAHANVEIEM